MFGGIVLSGSPENMSPNDPVVGAFGLLDDTFADLFDCIGHFSLLEFGEGPVAVCVVAMPVCLLGLFANADRFTVELVDVV